MSCSSVKLASPNHEKHETHENTEEICRALLSDRIALMSRPTRIAAAAVVALAVAAFPAVLDRCAATCEAHHEAIASTPSCHHVTSTAFRIGHVPTPCGHDHTGTAMTSAKSTAPVGRSIGSMAAAVALPSPFAPAVSDRRVLGHAPPGPSVAVDGRSLPL